MTADEHTYLLRKIRKQPNAFFQINDMLRKHPVVVVRIEEAGQHRRTVGVTQEDLMVIAGQLTLLGEL